MTFGEKVWEDTGKVTGLSIKSVWPDGVNIEINYSGEFKGFGTLPGGTFVGTLNRVQKSNGISVGIDQGILTHFLRQKDAIVVKEQRIDEIFFM